VTIHKVHGFRVFKSLSGAAILNQCENHSVLPNPYHSTHITTPPLQSQTMAITIIIIIIVYTQRAYTNDFLHNNVYMSVFNVCIEDEPAHIPHILYRVFIINCFLFCVPYILYLLLKCVIVHAKLFNPKQSLIRPSAFMPIGCARIHAHIYDVLYKVCFQMIFS